jgi:hypothetical protein
MRCSADVFRGPRRRISGDTSRKYAQRILAWAITIGVASVMNFALGSGLHRSIDELFVDLILSGFSTACGLASASMWWDRHSDGESNQNFTFG